MTGSATERHPCESSCPTTRQTPPCVAEWVSASSPCRVVAIHHRAAAMFRVLGIPKPPTCGRVHQTRKRRRRARWPSLEPLEQRLVLSDVSGNWQGTLSEPPLSGPLSAYNLTISFTQSGNNVQGTEHAEVASEPQYYADYVIKGNINQSTNAFDFQQTSITDQNPAPGASFITASYKTQISSDDKSITGTWAVGTLSGDISLQRVPPLPDIAVASSPNPSAYGQAVTFTATVSPASAGMPTPTGSITFMSGSSVLGTGQLNASGNATYTTTSAQLLPTGVDTITASYSGDSNFGSASGSVTQTVNLAGETANITTTVTPSTSSQSVTITATVSPAIAGLPAPTGSVTFLDTTPSGTTINLGTYALSNGTVSFTTTALVIGANTITADYSGDSTFGSDSGSASQTLAPSNEVFFSSFIRGTTGIGNVPGVQLTYTTLNVADNANVIIDLYWSSSPNFSGTIGLPAFTINNAQDYGQVFVSRQDLGSVPYGARYLVAVAYNDGILATTSVQLFHTLTIQDVEAVVSDGGHNVPQMPSPVVIPPGKLTKKQEERLAKQQSQYKLSLQQYNEFMLITNIIVTYLNSQEAFQDYQINYPERQAGFIGSMLVETAYLTTLTQARPFGVVGKTTNYGIGRGYLQITSKPNYKFATNFLFPFTGDKSNVSPQQLSSTVKLLATDPQIAAKVSGWFWNGGTHHLGHSLNSYADTQNWLTVGQIVNIGEPAGQEEPNGWTNRETDSNNALKIINSQLG